MKMKKIISVFLAVVISLSLFTFYVSAASATFSLSGSGSVIVGNQVKVNISLNGSEKIGSWRFSLNYDPAYLEYVSGADSGGGGAVLFADSSDGVSSLSKTVVFRAKKIGSVTVSIGGIQVVGFDSASNMSANAPSKVINIEAAPTLSAENNLSELSVSEGAFEPAFDAKTTEYSMTVPFEIPALTVSATAKDKKASVSVSGGDALVVGENKVTVTVTAENGKAKKYVITVTRQESELAGVTTEFGGTTYSVAYDPATLQIPANFTASTAQLGEKKILVYASPKEAVFIAYLFTESDGAWYVFDKENQKFTEFNTLSGAANEIVLLEPNKDVKVPKEFIPKNITVGEREISAYSAPNSEEEKVYLVYGMAYDGTIGFFFYDTVYGTFTSYFEAEDNEAEVSAKEVAILSNLLEDSEKKVDQMEIIALAVGVLAAILFIVIIILIAIRSKKATPDFEETVLAEDNDDPQTEEDSKIEEESESYGEEKEEFLQFEEEKEIKELIEPSSSDSIESEDVIIAGDLEETAESKKKVRKARRTISEIDFKKED